jgi:hypothetical protein
MWCAGIFFFGKGGVLVTNNEPCGVCKHGRARGRLGHAEQGAELLAALRRRLRKPWR